MMTDDELIARLDAAPEGSRELDEAVAKIVGCVVPVAVALGHDDGCWVRRVCGKIVEIRPGVGAITSSDFYLPRYTTSLDAALTLVPEGWWLQHLGHNLDGYGVRLETQGISIPNSMRLDRSPTPALALCIAALRARKA